jgi:threonine 3-dehydrogenase
MKALILNSPQKNWDLTHGMEIADVSSPTLDEKKHPEDANKTLIKPLYAGFCGSDKSIWFRKAFKDMIFNSLDLKGGSYRVCGHELLGEILETGSVAERHYGYKPGDIVTTESHIFCGKCHQCQIGEAHVCSNHEIIGITTDGCFADRVKLPAKELWKTDISKIRPEVAAIQEPLGNAVHACSRVDLRGKSVAIFGCGTIGLFSVIVARALGAAYIIGTDTNSKNLELAEKLGIDLAIKIPEENNPEAIVSVIEQIRKDRHGEGVDASIEMAGSNDALNAAIASVRPGGDIILFGIASGDYTISNFQEIVMNGKSLHSVVGRQVFKTWHILNNLLLSKETKLQEKIYEIILNKGVGTLYPFDKFNPKEFEESIQSHPKIVFKF